MRIVALTDAVTEKMIAARRRSDTAAEGVAAGIVDDVRKRGDAAVFAWTRKLDGAALTPKTMWVTAAERKEALKEVTPELRSAMEHAARNIRRVAEKQKPQPWSITVEPGVRVGQQVTPLDTIGCYVPGGRYSLVSTLLMTAVPAQVAGVRRIVVTCPKANAGLLAAAEILGVKEIAHIGGAQAIAAMTYGTKSVPRVDKIFGPGNKYVAAAKRLVSTDCAVDLPAGPTEVVIVAAGKASASRDARPNARYIAADLIAQAEHDPDAVAVLVTTSQLLALAVQESVSEQLAALPPNNPARRALADNGAILLARDTPSAVRFANRFAPEHLSVPDGDPSVVKQLNAAGSLFIGPWAAQSVGDYASGTNHVLPTSGGARARGGLSTWDFVRCASVQEISRAGLKRLDPVVSALADAEGLVAHRRAVEVRR